MQVAVAANGPTKAITLTRLLYLPLGITATATAAAGAYTHTFSG